jgi:15-cis-phytoene synthase
VSESDILEQRNSEAMRKLVLFQVERAESYFQAAEPLLKELEFDARFPTLLMGAIYARVLKKIRREPLRPLHERISLPSLQKIAVVVRALLHPHFV